MDWLELKPKVVEMAKLVAAHAGRELSQRDLSDVWRTTRPMILDHGWSIQFAVTYEVHRRLHLTEDEPWASKQSS